MYICVVTERDQHAGMSTALPSYSFDSIGTAAFPTLGSSGASASAASGRYIQDDLPMPSIVLPNGNTVPFGTLDAGLLTGIHAAYNQTQLPMSAAGQLTNSSVSALDSLNLSGTVSLSNDELTQVLQRAPELTEMASDEFLRLVFQQTSDGEPGPTQQFSEH